VSSSTVLTVNYSDAVGARWPRMLRLLAGIVMVFAILRLPTALLSMQAFWPFDRDPYNTAPPRLYWSFFISSVVELIIDGLLFAGALHLRRRGSSRLMLIGCWALLIHLLAGIAIAAIVIHRQYWSILSSTVVQAGQMGVFPLIVILLFRAWRMG
jgi:hypothetical protein